MRLPRDVSGAQLSKVLSRFGYVVSRQTGSHIRLTSEYAGLQHHITIPRHDPLKVGTLNATLSDVAEYLSMSRTDLIAKLFG